MPLRVQQNVIRFDVAMNDALRMDIFERAAQLCNPESNSILRKAFPRDMEPQVTTIHQIHHNVSSKISMRLERGRIPERTCIQYPENCIAGCTGTDG